MIVLYYRVNVNIDQIITASRNVKRGASAAT